MAKSLHSHNHDVFRKLLVEARKDVGLTQSEVAKRLNVPQSFVSKYEIGERRIDFIEFIEIAELLNIDLAVFIKNYKKISS